METQNDAPKLYACISCSAQYDDKTESCGACGGDVRGVLANETSDDGYDTGDVVSMLS